TFRYKYRMIGLDTPWTYTDSRSGLARFNALPPGKYVFEVKAVNEDGVESAAAATLQVFVKSPYWQQWWFYMMLPLLTALFLTLAFLVRIRNEKKKAGLRQELVDSRLTALKAQMNPHFLFNTLNSIQHLVIGKQVENANYYLSRFSDL